MIMTQLTQTHFIPSQIFIKYQFLDYIRPEIINEISRPLIGYTQPLFGQPMSLLLSDPESQSWVRPGPGDFITDIIPRVMSLCDTWDTCRLHVSRVSPFCRIIYSDPLASLSSSDVWHWAGVRELNIRVGLHQEKLNIFY